MKYRHWIMGLCAFMTMAVLIPKVTAESSPSQTYLAYVEAVQSGDFEKVKSFVSQTQLQTVKPGEGQNYMKMLMMLSPTEVKIFDERIEGDRATLQATGKNLMGECTGNITLIKEEGQWKVDKEDWKG